MSDIFTSDRRYWMRSQSRKVGHGSLYLLEASRYILAFMEARCIERAATHEISDDWFLQTLMETSFEGMQAWYARTGL